MVRRVTIDDDTHRVIQDLKTPHNVPLQELYANLPEGVKNTRTILYYKDDITKSKYVILLAMMAALLLMLQRLT